MKDDVFFCIANIVGACFLGLAIFLFLGGFGIRQVDSMDINGAEICLIEEIELASGKRATRELWIGQNGSSSVVSADEALGRSDWDALNQVSGKPISGLEETSIRLVSSSDC